MIHTKEHSLEVFSDKVDPLYIGNPIRIGIIGGGQLAKMIAQVAKRMYMQVKDREQ